jgi:hypothetical protein
MSSKNVRLFGPAALTAAAATKYTVPASTVTVLQYIHVSNPTASAVTFTMSIGADAAGTRIYGAFSIPAGGVLDVPCKYVLNAAEIIQAFAGTDAVLILTLNGQELTPG